MAYQFTIARPYAKAAFEYAVAANNIDKWSALLKALAIVVSDKRVRTLIDSPKLTPQQLQEVMTSLVKEELFVEGENFLKLLVVKHRLTVIPEIMQLFEEYRTAHEQTIMVSVTAAFPVAEATIAKFTQALKKRLQCNVKLMVDVNELLLGGAIIRAGDLVIDGSVKTSLDKLYHQLCY